MSTRKRWQKGQHKKTSSPVRPVNVEDKYEKILENLVELSDEFKDLKSVNYKQERIVRRLEGKVQSLEGKLEQSGSNNDESSKQEILSLREEKEKMGLQILSLKRELEQTRSESIQEILSLRKDYERHYETFHRDKYSLTKVVVTPQIKRKREERDKFYCFVDDSFLYHFDFAISSGPKSSTDNIPIDFEGLQVLICGDPIRNIKISSNSIEFGVKYPKIGLYELTILFHNIKETSFIEVQPSVVCSEKCEILLFRGEIQPTGDVIPSPQPTDKFSSKDHIQVIIKLANENGIPISEKKYCEDLFLTAKVCEEGKKSGMRGILSSGRILEVDFGEIGDSFNFGGKSGEVLIFTIEEGKLGMGKYLLSVFEEDFGTLKKNFVVQ